MGEREGEMERRREIPYLKFTGIQVIPSIINVLIVMDQ